ncbi:MULTISPECIES: DUF3145 domain-containing protein [Brachybacterium]|uniref:DUF3145 domain-containing protein n=1 Tax=Brachybacterium rhamnosum TaxID=173361 RepID=A0ABW4Q0P7_9MICO|nr:DUF3145 domain-containing protein [Brachybacterium squillarum]MCW1804470.1 DUF3145 domain-containing protein [Brachybacterium squillarum]
MTQGVVHIHSAPRALTPHIEWAASGVLGMPCRIRWEEQPAHRGMLRGEMTWRGREDTGARLVSALRGMHEVRFEVTQEATTQEDGSRWSCTPDLGIHYAMTDRAGNTVLGEDQVRGAMERAGADPTALHRELGIALGEPWDEELEIYRHGAEGAPMRWLHRVG